MRRSALADWNQDDWEALTREGLGTRAKAMANAASFAISFAMLGRRGKRMLKEIGDCVYAFTSDKGELIYIGVTNNFWNRFKKHQQGLFNEIEDELYSILVWEMPYADALKVEHLMIQLLSDVIKNRRVIGKKRKAA